MSSCTGADYVVAVVVVVVVVVVFLLLSPSQDICRVCVAATANFFT